MVKSSHKHFGAEALATVSEAIGTANSHPCERLSALTFALAAH
jgi:hypothetical protein